MSLRERLIERNRAYWYGPGKFALPGSKLRLGLVRLRHPHVTFRVEQPIRVDRGLTVFLPGRCEIVIEPYVWIRPGVHIEMNHGSRLVVGERTILSHFVVIQCMKEIVIGKRCGFASGTTIVDARHRYTDYERGVLDNETDVFSIHIGDDVICGSKTTIQADIGERAMIGAHSMVSRAIPAWTFAVGAPCRPQKYFGPPDLAPEGVPVVDRA